MKRSRAGVSKRKFIVHWPTSVWITPPGRTPGHVPTPTGSLPSAAGTPISEHLAPPSVNDDALTAAGWFCVDAVPDPAEAASGMTSAASTPSTGISRERRILNPPFGRRRALLCTRLSKPASHSLRHRDNPDLLDPVLTLAVVQRILDQLDQRAESSLGVDEGHGGAPAARAGGLVDHPVALALHPVEGIGAAVDPVADV